jgi:hypothetical protein
MAEEGKFNRILSGSISAKHAAILTVKQFRALILRLTTKLLCSVFFVKLPFPAKIASFSNFTDPILCA